MNFTKEQKILLVKHWDSTGVLFHCSDTECLRYYPKFVAIYRKNNKTYKDSLLSNMEWAAIRLKCRLREKYGRKIAFSKFAVCTPYVNNKRTKF